MVRSRKTTFRKKSQRKAKQSRKQRGGENNLTWPLDERDRVFPDGKYKNFKILYTEEPINIPWPGMTGIGDYIGEYYLDKNGDPIMMGRGRLVYKEENPANGMHTIYDGYWTENKKDGAIDFEYRNGDNGYAEFDEDALTKPNKWHFAPTYNYADGRVYEGELVIKDGRAVPLDYDEVPPRTVFNFAPGPKDFLNYKGDYVELDKREAERGFRMSQDPNFVPPVPPNSPQRESVVVRRGPGLKSRLSQIKDSRLSAVESGPLDRAEELRQMRELASSQTGFKSLSRVSALPPIKSTRKGGKYRKRGKKTKRRR
uniref:MORN repeat-containing protein n=1 Tax=viral metagenome TaxID=1070528 RepID=A0A6C0DU57_9ZZZZ